MKTVDKYQFNQQQYVQDNGVMVVGAFHTILKKKFTIKTIPITTSNQQQIDTYNCIANEVAILKKLNHNSVCRCHKMLKTKNWMYFIYDDITGKSLSDAAPQMTHQNKMAVLRKLIEVMVYVHRQGVVKINLQPKNIIILPQGTIKLINFGLSCQLSGEKQWIDINIPNQHMTKYSPPQLKLKRAYSNSDVFSLGLIIQYIFKQDLNKSTKKNTEYQNINKILNELAQKMIQKYPASRINILQVQRAIQKIQTGASPQKISQLKRQKSSLHMTAHRYRTENMITQISRTKSVRNSKQASVASSRNISKKSSNQNQQKLTQISNSINKKQMANTCISTTDQDIKLCLKLSFLLVKKAKCVVTQLKNLFLTGQSRDIKIQPNIQSQFFKTKHFLQMQRIIKLQSKQIDQKYKLISASVSQTPHQQDKFLTQQLKHQTVLNDYLRQCVSSYINNINISLQQTIKDRYSQQDLMGIYLISLLSIYPTYEQAYEKLFAQAFYRLQDEPFFKQLQKLTKGTLIQLINQSSFGSKASKNGRNRI